MKPALDDYKAFAEAAAAHRQLFVLTGLEEHLRDAQRMEREATERRLAALYPPQRCVECSATIHSDQIRCSACGRARQGVGVNVRALLRFFENYDMNAAEAMFERQRRAHAEQQVRRTAATRAARASLTSATSERVLESVRARLLRAPASATTLSLELHASPGQIRRALLDIGAVKGASRRYNLPGGPLLLEESA